MSPGHDPHLAPRIAASCTTLPGKNLPIALSLRNRLGWNDPGLVAGRLCRPRTYSIKGIRPFRQRICRDLAPEGPQSDYSSRHLH